MRLEGLCVHQDRIGFTIHGQYYRTPGSMYLIENFAGLTLQICDGADIVGQFHDHNVAWNPGPLKAPGWDAFHSLLRAEVQFKTTAMKGREPVSETSFIGRGMSSRCPSAETA